MSNADSSPSMEVATLGGGCFWCLEAVYQEVRGVKSIVSGYAGGHVANPKYSAVGTGATGHAEVVQITFDPSLVSYRQLLEVFFTVHDPTTLNRQGADIGTQYRSIVLYHSAEQKRVAEEVMEEFTRERIWPNQIVTEVEPMGEFYPAEGYHQNYYRSNPQQAYCQIVIAPKVAKFRKQFLAELGR
jgi:peptide-methionine (S)-S-oxide reductase